MAYSSIVFCCTLFIILNYATHSYEALDDYLGDYDEDYEDYDEYSEDYIYSYALNKKITNEELKKKYELKGSMKEKEDQFMEEFLKIFDQTVDKAKEAKIKKELTKDEYHVRIGAMMKQAYARIKQTPTENILNYNYLDDDDPQLPLPGDPNFQYDEEIIEEAIARHRRQQRFGTEFPHNDNPATEENPIVYSPQRYGQYEVVVWDVGEMNEHYLPTHMFGVLELVKNGRGLENDGIKVLEISIHIPKLRLRCCDTSSDLAQIKPKYLSDSKSIHFRITAKNKLLVEGKFIVKYSCNVDVEPNIGYFEYKLELKNTKLKSVDYTKMKTIEIERSWRKKKELIQYGKLIQINDGESQQSVKLEYPTKGLSGYPPKPVSMKGVIKAKFVSVKGKEKHKNTNPNQDLKINLGSPASPSNPERIAMETINSISEKSSNNSKHDEL